MQYHKMYVPGCGPDDANFAVAGNEPVEGEVFGNVFADQRVQMLEAVLRSCLNGLKDAATVVDAGDDEGYAYQHEIEAAEAVLSDGVFSGYENVFALRDFNLLRHLLAELGQAVLDSKSDDVIDVDPRVRAKAQAARQVASRAGDALDRYMSTGRHTPGVWQIEADAENAGRHPYHDWRYVTSTRANGKKVTICKMMDGERMAHDARLIAASPEMEATLRVAYRYLAKMVADDVQTVVPPQAVMSRIEDMMAFLDCPIK